MVRSRRSREAGFSLIEVMVALLIVSIAVILLLERRILIVRETAENRDKRSAITLLAQKMAELELDSTLLKPEGAVGTGDFSDQGLPDYRYSFDVMKEEVATNDPANEQEKPKEVFKLTLKVTWPKEPGEGEVSLQGVLAAPKQENP